MFLQDVSFCPTWTQEQALFFSPIHTDNVACYGSETKLTECMFHKDTSEDKHSEDVWVSCSAKNSLLDSLKSA